MATLTPPPRRPSPVFNLPNNLTTGRLALAVVLFILIALQSWLWCLVVFALVLASLALSFTVVGALALLGVTLSGVRRLGRAERARAGLLIGVAIADPHLPVEGKWWQRIMTRATRAV